MGTMMAREDYDAIQIKFEAFAKCLRHASVEGLDDILMPDTKCYLSVVRNFPDGGQHSLYGIRDFVRDMPQFDVCHSKVCNFICYVADGIAQQSAVLVTRFLKFLGEDDLRYFECDLLFSNKWMKTETGWKICELRMDMAEPSGDFTEFQEQWFHEDLSKGWFPGMQLPCVNGDLDAPWIAIPNTDVQLSDEEQILLAYYRYAFGIDTNSMAHLADIFTEDFEANMPPCTGGRREFMSFLKHGRKFQSAWTHPAIPDTISIHGDEANVRLYRPYGHPLEHHPLVFTRENCEHRFACARYEMKAKKENGTWKISKMCYFLGLIDLGKFGE